MGRFLVCCAVVMLLAGCGMMKNQQTGRPLFAAPERPAIASHDDDNVREPAKPRESFFRRVFFGRSNER